MKGSQFFLLLLVMVAGFAGGWYLFNYAAPKIEKRIGYTPEKETVEKSAKKTVKKSVPNQKKNSKPGR